MSAAKPKVAFYWCSSCGGCEEAVVDLAEKLLDVVAAVDIVFWPVALDFKKDDVEALADGEITASFVNGAIRTSEQEEMAHLLRRKSQLLFAFGACAQLGGIPGLANLWDRETIFEELYRCSPTLAANGDTAPQEHVDVDEGRLDLPGFDDTVRTLDQVVDVDYYVPGCPPTPNVIADALQALLGGELPPKGSVLASPRALCFECPLAPTKPERPVLADIKRVWEIVPDPDTCLLAQGILCLGPVTRGGCEALCISAHMPCTGCFGPLDRVLDFGAKGLSATASLLDANEEDELTRLADRVPDPVGTFYRYSLPASLLRRRVNGGTE